MIRDVSTLEIAETRANSRRLKLSSVGKLLYGNAQFGVGVLFARNAVLYEDHLRLVCTGAAVALTACGLNKIFESIGTYDEAIELDSRIPETTPCLTDESMIG